MCLSDFELDLDQHELEEDNEYVEWFLLHEKLLTRDVFATRGLSAKVIPLTGLRLLILAVDTKHALESYSACLMTRTRSNRIMFKPEKKKIGIVVAGLLTSVFRDIRIEHITSVAIWKPA